MSEKLSELAGMIKTAAARGIVLRAEADSAGLTLHFQKVTPPNSLKLDHRITWEELVAASFPLLADTVNRLLAAFNNSVDSGAPRYTLPYASGGEVAPRDLPRFGEHCSDTVIPLDQYRKLTRKDTQ